MTARLSAIAGKFPMSSPVATPLFDTIFAGLVLGTPTKNGDGSNNWTTTFTSTTDTVTGFDVSTDLQSIFGAGTQLIIDSLPESEWTDIADFNTYISNTLRASTYSARYGAQELELKCKIREALGSPNPQTDLLLKIPGSTAVANPVRRGYFELVFKPPVGLDLQAASNDSSTGHFWNVLEGKRGGFFDAGTYKTSFGDWRMLIGITGESGVDKWVFRLDDVANGYPLIPGVANPSSPNIFYTNSVNDTIRLGVWHTLKLYFNFPAVHTDKQSGIIQAVLSPDGYPDIVLANLVNDGVTQMAGVADLPPTRWFTGLNYASAGLPNPQTIARLSIWDKPPSILIP